MFGQAELTVLLLQRLFGGAKATRDHQHHGMSSCWRVVVARAPGVVRCGTLDLICKGWCEDKLGRRRPAEAAKGNMSATAGLEQLQLSCQTFNDGSS